MHGARGIELDHHRRLPSDPSASPAAPTDDAASGGSNGKSDDATGTTAHASRDDASGDAAGTGDAGRRHAETPACAGSGSKPARQEVTAGVAPERGGR